MSSPAQRLSVSIGLLSVALWACAPAPDIPIPDPRCCPCAAEAAYFSDLVASANGEAVTKRAARHREQWLDPSGNTSSDWYARLQGRLRYRAAPREAAEQIKRAASNAALALVDCLATDEKQREAEELEEALERVN
ncbi:MAG: hypothetical protein OXP74_11280 [Acidobacteriota bacterium]|nr:hypothetical protein [Acidobacteriota bacterium]